MNEEIVLGTTRKKTGKTYTVDIGAPKLLYSVEDRSGGNYPDNTGVYVSIPMTSKTRPFIVGESQSRIPVAVRVTV